MALCNLSALMSLVFMEMVSVKWVGDVGRAERSGQADDFALGQAGGKLCLHHSLQAGRKSGPFSGILTMPAWRNW